MNKELKEHQEALKLGIQPVINAVKIPHISFFAATLPIKPREYLHLADGTLLIACPSCGRVALMTPMTAMYKQITSGIGMRCSLCNFQCHTHLMERGQKADE